MNEHDWVIGDSLGLRLPAHAEALREGGVAFLTNAFRAAGALSSDNQVTRITRFEESLSGGTGRKVVLSVEYAKADPRLHRDLFVKFSRDFADPIRDRSKHLMEAEVQLALLSRQPGFPTAVPTCMFADYERESGTGILITQRVAFGESPIEAAYEKCLDYELPDAIAYYTTLLRAVARLAGTHRGGRLGPDIEALFPFEPHKLAVSDRIPYDATQLSKKIARLQAFVTSNPQLFPVNVSSPDFLARFAVDAPRFHALEKPLKAILYAKSDFIALCHWNANIDNGWFWRKPDGELECGLLDWGRVGQLNIAQAIFGALCAAETSLWDAHLESLLAMFAAEYHAQGGPQIDPAELKLHVQLFTALMGLAWIMDAPAIIKAQLPDVGVAQSRFDQRFRVNALARVQLQLLTVFLNAWERHNFGAVLERVLREHDALASLTPAVG